MMKKNKTRGSHESPAQPSHGTFGGLVQHMQHVSQIKAAALGFWVTHSSNMMQSHCALINLSIIPDKPFSLRSAVGGRTQCVYSYCHLGFFSTWEAVLHKNPKFETCWILASVDKNCKTQCLPSQSSSLSLHEPNEASEWGHDATAARKHSLLSSFIPNIRLFCPLHSITSSSHLLLPSAPLYPRSLTSFFLLSSLLYHTFPAQMSLHWLSNKGNKCVFINMKYLLYSSSFFYTWPWF